MAALAVHIPPACHAAHSCHTCMHAADCMACTRHARSSMHGMHAACLHFDAWHARSRLHARMRQACPAGMPCACIQDRRSGAGTSATRVRCAGQVAAARGHGASAAGTRADQRRAATELCRVAARLAPKSWPPRALLWALWALWAWGPRRVCRWRPPPCCFVLLVPTPKVYREPRVSHRTQTVCAYFRRWLVRY